MGKMKKAEEMRKAVLGVCVVLVFGICGKLYIDRLAAQDAANTDKITNGYIDSANATVSR